MKKTYLLLSIIILINCASTKVYVKDEYRLSKVKKIAVIPFLCNQPEIGYNISSSLSSNLVASRFRVIERAQLNRILEEQGLSLSGIIEDYSAVIGKIKGVDALIVGNATVSSGWAGTVFGGYINYVSNCSVRMVDVTSGEVLLATNFTSESASTLKGVTTASEVGDALAKKIAQY